MEVTKTVEKTPTEIFVNDVHRLVSIWTGLETVYSEYKPKKNSCELTIYLKVWGTNFRLDWEYDVPPGLRPGIDPSLEAAEICKQFGLDIQGLWAAGPDRQSMDAYMYGERFAEQHTTVEWRNRECNCSCNFHALSCPRFEPGG